MSSKISQKIDHYTRSHIKELKTEERKQGKKFTKYEIAQFMLSKNMLSQSDFAAWMNTKEGADSEIYSRMQQMARQSGSIWGYNNVSYLDGFSDYTPDVKDKASGDIESENKAREAAVDILSGIASTAYSKVRGYHDSIGYLSFDAVWQGLNVIGNGLFDSVTGRNDFATVFEYEAGLQHEIDKLNKLKSKTKKQNEFAKEFKNLYGIDFNPEAFKKLGEANKKLNELNTYSALSKYLEEAIDKMKDADINSVEPVVLLSPIFGNPNKANEFIVSLNCKDDTELREKLVQIMQEAKTEADEKLQTMNREELESNFKTAYKNAMGEYNADEITEKFIQSSKTNAMLLETGAIIGASLLTAGSASVMKLGSKAVKTLGTRMGRHALKAGMTAATAAMPAAETIVGGLTSKEGLTLDKGKEAWEQLKSGLMYGAFGAYVSGPLGEVVKNTLAKNPNIFKSILSSHKFTLVAGTTTETTADVLFDKLTGDMSIRESLEQNGLMNFGMMVAGARMNNAANLSNIKIEKMRDGTYNVKENGKVLCKAKDENELSFVVLSLAAEKNKATGAQTVENQKKIPDEMISQIQEKLCAPERDYLSPENAKLHTQEFIKLFSKYPDVEPETIIGLINNPNLRMRIRDGKVDFNLFDKVLELTSQYPEYQKELLTLAQNENYSINDIKEVLVDNPQFKELADVVGAYHAFTGLKDGITDFGIDKFGRVNEIINGPEPQALKDIKNDFKQNTGIDLHFDNNINPQNAAEYARVVTNVIERYKKAGKTPPKQIFITSFVPENADGAAFARKYPDVIAVKPSENPEWFEHCVFHEAVHLTDMTMKHTMFQYKPIGAKPAVKDGKIVMVINKQEAADLTASIEEYIGAYAAYDTNEFTAEFGAMLMENKIIINKIEINGDIQNEIIIKEPFINNDGRQIEVTPEVRQEIEKIVDYYFNIGGQNYPNA